MADPITIRSSSWGDLLDCPSRWEAIHILGMRSPASVPAHIGSSVHHGSAIFDQARVENRIPTVEEAVHAAVERFQHPEDEVDWKTAEESMNNALATTIRSTEAYCTRLSPLFDFSDVELRPVPLQIDVDGQVIEISGQMDRTRILKDQAHAGIGISDLKTGRAVVNGQGLVKTNGMKFQIGIYEILAGHSMHREVKLPGTIAAVSTGAKAHTGIGEIHGAKELMIGTDEQPGIIHTAGLMVKQGLFPPNPRSMLCGKKWCPRWHTCKAHD